LITYYFIDFLFLLQDYLKDGGMLSEGGDAPAEPPINIDKMGSESNVCWENINKVHADILKGEKSNCSPLLSSKVGM
jgi:hypothetical protein